MSTLLKISIIAHMVVFWSASDENVILEIFAAPLLWGGKKGKYGR